MTTPDRALPGARWDRKIIAILLRTALVTSFALFLTITVDAGFTIQKKLTGVPRGGTKATKKGLEKARANNKPYPEISEAPKTADAVELAKRPPFSGLTPAQTTKRLADLRERILCVIELLRKEDPALADCLQSIYSGGRLCIGFDESTKKHSKKPRSSGLKTAATKGKDGAYINIGLLDPDPANKKMARIPADE
ncbi:MAG: hypothetical protein ACI9R3_006416 [Verrucomicrobiales bacterium]|jgi:hypothetical protein